jgi:hypothetical protein
MLEYNVPNDEVRTDHSLCEGYPLTRENSKNENAWVIRDIKL